MTEAKPRGDRVQHNKVLAFRLRPRSKVGPVVAGVDAVLTIPVVILATACRTWRRHDVDNGRQDVDNGWHDVDNGRHGVDNGRHGVDNRRSAIGCCR